MSSPLLETDLTESGVLDPGALQPQIDNLPRVAVLCFFREVVDGIGIPPCADLSIAGGCPVRIDDSHGARTAVLYPGLGAPAAAMAMEEMIAHGCRTFIALGGAGALLPDLGLGAAMVVDKALRDEGTSHHYLPAGRFVDSDPDVSSALLRACQRDGIPAHYGTTWTTDAIFRETRGRIGRRVDEGCSMVEMEAAALLAVARFRGARAGQLLYAGDTLAADQWDSRGWMTAQDVRSSLFQVAMEAAAELSRLEVL